MMKHALLFSIGVIAASAARALTVDEQVEMVAAHNKWRQEAGVPDVQWSPAIAATAQKWADTLKTRHACNMTHSATKGLGENLYRASAVWYSNGTTRLQQVTPAKVTDRWASEKQNYNYTSNACAAGQMCGHYTQVVWKTTTEIGCAKAVCGDNTQVWVCNYAPPGNWRGQRPF